MLRVREQKLNLVKKLAESSRHYFAWSPLPGGSCRKPLIFSGFSGHLTSLVIAVSCMAISACCMASFGVKANNARCHII